MAFARASRRLMSPGDTLWAHRYPRGAAPPAPARPRQGAARARPRAHKARAAGEEAHHGHQEECKVRPDGESSAPPSRAPARPSFRRAQNACKVMAKDLVRTRRYVQKFYQMRTQLQAVGLRIQTLRSNQQMAEAMRGASRVRREWHCSKRLPNLALLSRPWVP